MVWLWNLSQKDVTYVGEQNTTSTSPIPFPAVPHQNLEYMYFYPSIFRRCASLIFLTSKGPIEWAFLVIQYE
jgi:hypothetical protein